MKKNSIPQLVELSQKGDSNAFELLFTTFKTRLHHSFKGNSNFYTWLYRIGFNLAITKINSSRENQIDEGFESTLAAPNNVESTIENSELFESVQALLNELPEEQRTAYILCEVDTKNYDEIANITGVPVGTVRSRIFRARQYLMENLKDRL